MEPCSSDESPQTLLTFAEERWGCERIDSDEWYDEGLLFARCVEDTPSLTGYEEWEMESDWFLIVASEDFLEALLNYDVAENEVRGELQDA